jgi:hypothetical protein
MIIIMREREKKKDEGESAASDHTWRLVVVVIPPHKTSLALLLHIRRVHMTRFPFTNELFFIHLILTK